MYGKYLLACVLFLWIILQGCQCSCGPYDLRIPEECTELEIDNGKVCYSKGRVFWRANFVCFNEFILNGRDELYCWNEWGYRQGLTWIKYNGNSECRPVSTTSTPEVTQDPSGATDPQQSDAESLISPEETSGNLAVYITIPIIVIGLLAAGVAVFILYRRRRNASTSSGTSSTDTTISPVTNKAYEADDRERIPAEGTENYNAEYSEIPDAVDKSYDDSEYNTINSNGRINHGPNRNVLMIIGPNKDDNGEYNTINSGGRVHGGPNNDGRMNMSPNYNRFVLLSDSDYDHTASPVSVSREESDTYSHINGTVQNPRPYLINHSDNIYNGLRLNTGEFDKTAVNVQNDNPYDHTDSGLRKPANAVDDTYAHANIGFEENAEAQEYHDYFILEKMEHKSKN